MRAAVITAVLLAFVGPAASAQPPKPRVPAAAAPGAPVDRRAEAYAQFLLARHEEDDHPDLAIAAYKRAMDLDPQSADVPAELAALYLHENRVDEAMAAAEQSLKIDASNREANRVLGVVHAALAE